MSWILEHRHNISFFRGEGVLLIVLFPIILKIFCLGAATSSQE